MRWRNGWWVVGLCSAAVSVAGQETQAPVQVLAQMPAMAEPWWAIIGMGLVLLRAWSITRWIARPILAHIDATNDVAQAVVADPEPGLAASQELHLVSGDLALDLGARRARIADNEVTLTSTEFDLLRFFLTHEGQALARADLLREVWGHQQPVYSRTLDTQVQRLRDKLGPCRGQLETVRGVGYRLNAPVMA